MTNQPIQIEKTINGVEYRASVYQFGVAYTHKHNGGWRSVAQNARAVRMMLDREFRNEVKAARAGQ